VGGWSLAVHDPPLMVRALTRTDCVHGPVPAGAVALHVGLAFDPQVFMLGGAPSVP
jgi:hypothetical protein